MREEMIRLAAALGLLAARISSLALRLATGGSFILWSKYSNAAFSVCLRRGDLDMCDFSFQLLDIKGRLDANRRPRYNWTLDDWHLMISMGYGMVEFARGRHRWDVIRAL